MAGMLAAAAVFVATYPRLKDTLEAGSAGKRMLTGSTTLTLGRRPTPLDMSVRPGRDRQAAVQTALEPAVQGN